MLGKYLPYIEYQESGEEWLGKVPDHWDVIQIKHLSAVKRGASPRPIDDAKYFDEDGDYVWTRIADVTASDVYLTKAPQRLSALGSSLSVKLEPESLFLSIAGTVGKPCITGMKACIHDGFVYFPDLKIPSKFLFYVFAGEQAYKGLGKFGTQLNLNTDTVGGIKIGCTENEELEGIINFLDHETAKIDTLIGKQQQLIKLLKEKRQAVISHAVTKGLNPDAPMRDSGVEWLGKVPAHWVNCTLRRYADFVDGDRGSEYPSDKDFKDDGVVFLSSKNIIEEKLNLTEVKFISQEKFNALNRGKALDGDLIVKVRGSVGRIGELAKFETSEHGYKTAFINAQMMIIRTRKGLLTNYLRLVSQGLYWTEQLAVGAYGTAQQQLSNDVFSNLYIVVPPEDEQLKINKKLELDLSTFNSLIGKAQKAIALMQERRTALISAAVTGKIDVRNWQEPLTTSINKPTAPIESA